MNLPRWHESKLRARFEETDQMGVVYYSKFFNWMEVGRVNLLRDLGLEPGEWRKVGFRIPVVQAHADYKVPAHFDDEILIRTRIGRIGNRSISFENEILRLPGMELLCTGHTVHAFLRDSEKAEPFPADVRARLAAD
jgi:acyl-CoA thioester hydrolase